MTRLAELLSGLCEVINAVAVRAEDVIGEWVDNWGPSPPTGTEAELSRARSILARWNEDAVIAWDGNGWVIGIPNDKLADLVNDTAYYFRDRGMR